MTGTPTAGRTVLVVDDEDLIRFAAVGLLNDFGFATLEAADAQQALAMFAAHPAIDVLLTDINMPGEPDGLGLAAQLSLQCPRLSIIVTSGRVRPELGQLPGGAAFVAKPYTGAQLIAAVISAS